MSMGDLFGADTDESTTQADDLTDAGGEYTGDEQWATYDSDPGETEAAATMSVMPTVDELLHLVQPQIPVPDLDEPDLDTPAPSPAPWPAPVEPTPAAPIPDLDAPPPPGPEPAPEQGDDVPADGVHGTPAAYTDNWFWQEEDGLCGPSATAQIISEYTGIDIKDPQYLAQRAVELGLFPGGDTSAGMTFDGIETLMEDQGVPCHQEQSSMADLEAKLSAGYGVIAFVDSGEIWEPDTEPGEDNVPDHALVVAGIDHTRGVVILSDPGSPNGSQEEVSIDQFADAWADSDNTMLVADAPDADLADAPAPAADPDLAASVDSEQRWAMLDLTDRPQRQR